MFKIISNKISNLKKYQRLILFLFIFVLFFLVCYFNLDPDFGWHLSSGNFYLVHNYIPSTDIFSYTASSFPWINHEWLLDVIIAILYKFGGYLLLSLVFASIWTLSLYLVSRKVNNWIVIMAAIALIPFAGIRAITVSMLMFSILIAVINSKKIRYKIIIIPIIFVLWSNLHGCFPAGLVCLLVYALFNRSKENFLILIFASLATLINPYGINIYTEIFRTAFDVKLHSQIREWSSFNLPFAAMPYSILYLAMLIITHKNNWKSYLTPKTALSLLFFVTSISSIRMIPIFVIFSENDLNETDQTLLNKLIGKPWLGFPQIVFNILFLIVIGASVFYYRDQIIPHNSEGSYPGEIINYIDNNPINGRIFNNYNYGGYLIWKLPAYKVYIDGRMPSWSKNGIRYMDNYLDVYSDVKFQKKEFSRYNIKAAIVDTGSKDLIKNLISQKWQIKYKTNSNILLEDN